MRIYIDENGQTPRSIMDYMRFAAVYEEVEDGGETPTGLFVDTFTGTGQLISRQSDSGHTWEAPDGLDIFGLVISADVQSADGLVLDGGFLTGSGTAVLEDPAMTLTQTVTLKGVVTGLSDWNDYLDLYLNTYIGNGDNARAAANVFLEYEEDGNVGIGLKLCDTNGNFTPPGGPQWNFTVPYELGTEYELKVIFTPTKVTVTFNGNVTNETEVAEGYLQPGKMILSLTNEVGTFKISQVTLTE